MMKTENENSRVAQKSYRNHMRVSKCGRNLYFYKSAWMSII